MQLTAGERIELNGFIERLIDTKGHDLEARTALAALYGQMPREALFKFDGTIEQSGSNVSGHTPEHGTVEIKDDHKVEREFSTGPPVERIGYYKLFRERDTLLIAHHWKSSEGTESETETAQQWALAVSKSGEPKWFGERAMQTLFTIGRNWRLTITLSRAVYVESWGNSPGNRHFGGFLIAVNVDAS